MPRSPHAASTKTLTEPPPGAISVRGLRKSFGDHLVLDGIDLEVAPGTVHALLGPNGSGKTTTVQILSTLIRRDGGEVRVGGHSLDEDPEAIRSSSASRASSRPSTDCSPAPRTCSSWPPRAPASRRGPGAGRQPAGAAAASGRSCATSSPTA